VTTTHLVDTLNPTGYAQVLDELQPPDITEVGTKLSQNHFSLDFRGF